MTLFFNTKYLLEITCADPFNFLLQLTDAGITAENIVHVDPLTVCLDVTGRGFYGAKKLADRLGAEIKVVRMLGIKALLETIKHRFVLICGIAIMVLMTLYIPTRVLFISVAGNERIKDTYILEQAENIGIFFGASRKEVRSENMKNALLHAIPDLKWAGINTYGCRAEIHVIERDIQQNAENAGKTVQGIYAARDGIVTSITVTKGSAMCKPGEAIREGQLLVSGYTDCGLITRAEKADGEVRGITQRHMDALLPSITAVRGAIATSKTDWSIQLGKKQIKFNIGSGNSGTGCGKIYKSYDLTLPGGFRLPISLVKQTVLTYEQVSEPTERQPSEIDGLADRYISESMIAGKVIDKNLSVALEGEVTRLTGVYTCDEMIGILKNEEIKQIDY